jgi:actin-like ATPase involved in cell morphogenesis
MRAWALAIDYGTTFTSAAVVTDTGVEVLEVEGVRRLPSGVVLLDDQLLVGVSAEQQYGLHADRAERTPKRALGVHPHLLLGGEPVETVDAVAATLRAVYEEALRRSNGHPPTEVKLTHPASWSDARLDALREAAARAGMTEVSLLPEPVAAALHFADEHIHTGDHVAVYDLGGGTFDTAVLRRTDDGFELAGPPGGNDRLGGEDFDQRLAALLREQLVADDPALADHLADTEDSAWRLAASQLLNAARQAKEALSRHTTHRVMLPPPIARELRVTRPELEALIHDDIAATVAELVATVERAGLTTEQIAARYLTGGSSRIPLVARLVHDAFAEAPDTFDDPKTAVAIGAAKSTRARVVRAGDDATAPTPALAGVIGGLAVDDTVDGSDDPTIELGALAGAGAAGGIVGGDLVDADGALVDGGRQPSRLRRRLPVLVAALVLLVVGAVAVAAGLAGDDGKEAVAGESGQDSGSSEGDNGAEGDKKSTTTTVKPTTTTAPGASAPGSSPPATSPPATSPPATSPPAPAPVPTTAPAPPAPTVNLTGPTNVAANSEGRWNATVHNASSGQWHFACVSGYAQSGEWSGPGDYWWVNLQYADSCTLTLTVNGAGGTRNASKNVYICNQWGCGYEYR